ncbi:MAG: hypothetical protein C6W57_05455 [Caldibacillus debilis]|uniref:PadR family transcriptional regulator n=1 Tax=Caldibacillus debilis TaxID=301148 RepID=UPI000E39DA16|nr:PadR family transcriptional regulator [Caldibacillus debilis]REJ17663.1 MAG: hypothetical protein C6W57_05455 [Caldibacillus debilis]
MELSCTISSIRPFYHGFLSRFVFGGRSGFAPGHAGKKQSPFLSAPRSLLSACISLSRFFRTEEWTNVLPGSLYHALKQLEKEGVVKVREVVRTGRRSKAVYEITEKGREAYTAMLREALQTPDLPYPRNFYSALAFWRIFRRKKSGRRCPSMLKKSKRRWKI